jgi:hypothetical protein
LPDFDVFKTVAREGYPKALRAVAGAMDALRDGVRLERIQYETRDVGGDRPLVALAAAGDPRSMVRRKPDAPRQRPVLSIVNSVIAPWFVNRSTILNRGAAILAWSMALNDAGVETEIVNVYCGGRHGTERKAGAAEIIAAVQVKTLGERYDIDRCSFALACPDFMRRGMFSLLECCPGLAPLSFGYGTCFDLSKEEIPANSVYLATLRDENLYRTPEAALKTVAEVIQRGAPSLRHVFEPLEQFRIAS